MMVVMILRYIAIKALEFVAASALLFILFSLTGETYWPTGPRTVEYTALGSIETVALYEIFLWYLAICTALWAVAAVLRAGKWAYIVGFPSIFVIHVTSVLFLFRVSLSWQLCMTILVMAAVEVWLALIFISKTKPTQSQDVTRPASAT